MKRLLCCLLAVVALGACWRPPPAPSANVVSVPATVDATCTQDVSAAFQAFLDTDKTNRTIALAPGACYRIEQPLLLRGADGLTVDGNGATIRRTEAGPDDGSARTRMLFSIQRSTNVVFKDLNIVGPHPEDGRRYAAVYEAQHAFWLDGDVDGFWLLFSSVSRIWGDVVYLGGRLEEHPRRVIVARNLFDLIGRHGVAVTGGEGVNVTENRFARVARSVMDLEPLGTGTIVADIALADNRIDDSERLFANGGAAAPHEHIRVTNNILTRTPMYFGALAPDYHEVPPYTRHDYVFDGNVSHTLPEGGHVVWAHGIDGLRITNNTWRMLARDYPNDVWPNDELQMNANQVVEGNTITYG